MSLLKPSLLVKSLLFAHLLVPTFLLIDVIAAWLVNGDLWWHGFGATGQLVFLCSLLWIFISIGALTAARFINGFPMSMVQGPLITVYVAIAVILIFELLLHVLPSTNVEPALWPPSQQALLQPHPSLMPGVEGASTFTGNNVGVRGPDLEDPDGVYKIVTVGGSTTESLYLDDSEEWSNVMMNILNNGQSSISVWVGNAGQSGRNTVDHLVLMRVLPIIPNADLIIFLTGLNDLQPTLAYEGNPTQEVLGDNSDNFKAQVLGGGGVLRPTWPIFKRTEMFELITSTISPLISKSAPYDLLGHLGVGPGSYIESRRAMRQKAPIVPLPNLSTGLSEYRDRITDLGNECESNELRCLFLTQPSMWRGGLTPREENLLWFGWIGREFAPIGYASTLALADAMNRYNSALIDICEEQNLECLDLASLVPKDTTAFYDDAHFNETGSLIVAESLANYIIENPPF